MHFAHKTPVSSDHKLLHKYCIITTATATTITTNYALFIIIIIITSKFQSQHVLTCIGMPQGSALGCGDIHGPMDGP